MLWLIEDFAAGGENEEKELLDCNIVARVTQIMEVITYEIQK